jgi:hypothetical protein
MERWILAAGLLAAAVYAARALRREWRAGQADEGPGCDCPLAERCRAARASGGAACVADGAGPARRPPVTARKG